MRRRIRRTIRTVADSWPFIGATDFENRTRAIDRAMREWEHRS